MLQSTAACEVMYSSSVFLPVVGGGVLTTLNRGLIERYFQGLVGMLNMASRPSLDSYS